MNDTDQLPAPANDTPHRSGRADYDKLIHFRQLDPGEGYFFVRARDPVVGDTARAYAVLAKRAGAPIALVESALKTADELDAWPTKRLANADHLTPAEQKQLEYEFEARAWRARDDAAELAVMLAEERALATVIGQLRPQLKQLLGRLERQENGDYLFRLKRSGEGGRQVEDDRPIEQLQRWLDTQGQLPEAAE